MQHLFHIRESLGKWRCPRLWWVKFLQFNNSFWLNQVTDADIIYISARKFGNCKV